MNEATIAFMESFYAEQDAACPHNERYETEHIGEDGLPIVCCSCCGETI